MFRCFLTNESLLCCLFADYHDCLLTIYNKMVRITFRIVIFCQNKEEKALKTLRYSLNHCTFAPEMKEKIRFTKMQGAGNDYIYVNTLLYNIPDPSTSAIAWSDRHKGIGSDGLVLIGAAPLPEMQRAGEHSSERADFSMRIFNADGSEAMMCGNAARCIGKYLYERGLTTQTQIRLLTRSGIKTLKLHLKSLSPSSASPDEESCQQMMVESVTVDMGEPVLEDDNLFNPQFAKSLSAPLHDRERQGVGSALFVSMGNPHYVIFTDDIDQVGETGRLLEHHPAFPQRCNIEFASLQAAGGDLKSPTHGDPAHKTIEAPSGAVGGAFRVRVWERGSGITQACGTGACATAVAACITGRAGRCSTIVMDGGTLQREWCETDRPDDGGFFQKNHVYLTGPAEFVFDGEIEL